MVISIIRRHRLDRAIAMQQIREDWWQLRRAAEARRPDTIVWRLQRVQQTRGMHKLTLPELMVASGTVR